MRCSSAGQQSRGGRQHPGDGAADDPDELNDPKVHGDEIYRVWAEYEMLERALSYRAEARVLAARLLDSFGISEKLPELPDLERDQRLQIVYRSKWPGKKTKILVMLSAMVTGRR